MGRLAQVDQQIVCAYQKIRGPLFQLPRVLIIKLLMFRLVVRKKPMNLSKCGQTGIASLFIHSFI